MLLNVRKKKEKEKPAEESVLEGEATSILDALSLIGESKAYIVGIYCKQITIKMKRQRQKQKQKRFGVAAAYKTKDLSNKLAKVLIAMESDAAATKLIDSFAKSFVLPKCQPDP